MNGATDKSRDDVYGANNKSRNDVYGEQRPRELATDGVCMASSRVGLPKTHRATSRSPEPWCRFHRDQI